MLAAFRRNNLNGVYDIHTNQMHYPRIMQPTHARIEQVVDSGNNESTSQQQPKSTVFPALNPSISRNFLVMDTHLETPPAGISPAVYDLPFRGDRSNLDYQISAEADFLAPFRGLNAVSEEIRALLPEECRIAFDEAREREREWLAKRANEKEATSRKDPVVDKAVVPYSKNVL
jgi:chromatin structure-remodeling complex protein RSC7